MRRKLDNLNFSVNILILTRILRDLHFDAVRIIEIVQKNEEKLKLINFE